MTIAGAFFPSVKAAHDVSPMNGGNTAPSTVIFTSLRGTVTLKVPSASLRVPLSPVAASMPAVSSAAKVSAGTRAKSARRDGVFMRTMMSRVVWGAREKINARPYQAVTFWSLESKRVDGSSLKTRSSGLQSICPLGPILLMSFTRFLRSSLLMLARK